MDSRRTGGGPVFGCGAGTEQERGANRQDTVGGRAGHSRKRHRGFKGIPYAAPPVGNLRWREPRPAARGRACGRRTLWRRLHPGAGLSAENGGDPGRLSEDCLYLNVWTPSAERSAKLPVMVWIHGGAYVFGAGGLPIYDGRPMAQKGAVFVSINYRLAPARLLRAPRP